ncbi:MAG: M14 family metallopeptidase [Pseudomonadota bacterium]
MKGWRRCALGAAFSFFVMAVAGARAAEDFFPSVEYDPAVPTPAGFLGHEIGAILARYDEVTGYLTALAAASERVSVETIGRSHEGRPILLVAITAPENQARLAALKAEHVARLAPGAPAGDGPVVTWLNYGVHGDEISGIEAVLGIAYHLAAVRDAAWDAILRDSVILNIVTLNPDGRDRSATWYNMYNARVPVADPFHREHEIPWPGGRTNHYWFDINRQWLPLTQPESQAFIAAYHDWKPHVVVDFHEMAADDTYYFHPGEAGRTHPLIPAAAEALLDALSRYPAQQLDAEKRPYFTAERFDNYYLGKGSTYPSVTGGVGILFEQSGSEGIAIDSAHGPQSYRENIRQHMNSGLAIIRGGHALRAKFLSYQKDFFESALKDAAKARDKAYVLAAPGDPARAEVFLAMLKRHHIDAYELARDVSADGVDFAAGNAYIVPTAQPQHRLIRGIFEVLTQFPRDSFYDISGWTLPYAYGLDFAALAQRDYDKKLLGAPWTAPRKPAASPPAEGGAGYVLDWRGYYAPRALYRLLAAGVRARGATQAMTLATGEGPVTVPAGAIVVSPGNNSPAVAAGLMPLLAQIAREDGVNIHAAVSGLTPAGPDLGGTSQHSFYLPRVMMLTGDDFSVYDAGEMWYLFDKVMAIPLAMRDRADFASLPLHRYTHLILPDGRPRLGDDAVDALKAWVRAGGVLIATQRAALWAAEKGFSQTKPLAPPAQAEGAPMRLDYGDKAEREAIARIAGAVFMSELDITHPLGFGLSGRRLASHRDNELFFAKSPNPYAAVAAYAARPLVSGYASAENLAKMAGTPSLVAERLGRGSVVLFADNPAFRGYWLGTHKLVMNAIFYAKAFSAPE